MEATYFDPTTGVIEVVTHSEKVDRDGLNDYISILQASLVSAQKTLTDYDAWVASQAPADPAQPVAPAAPTDGVQVPIEGAISDSQQVADQVQAAASTDEAQPQALASPLDQPAVDPAVAVDPNVPVTPPAM